MTNPIISLIDAWIGRHAVSADAASAAVAGRRPAVVVTGGSEGIGLAFARRFARAGHDIALVARRPEPLAQAVDVLRREATVQVMALPLDVIAPDAAERIEAWLAGQGFYLDILVNNAGIGAAGAFAEGDTSRLERMLDLNVKAATRLMRYALPGMIARGRGGILNVASLGGYTPGPFQAAYYASKAYLVSLSEAVASETSGQGVRICVVAPGPVATRFHARMGARNALYRWLMPSTRAVRVAFSGYWGFRLGRRVVVPGLVTTALGLAMRVLPHPLLVPFVGLLLKPRGSPDDDARTP